MWNASRKELEISKYLTCLCCCSLYLMLSYISNGGRSVELSVPISALLVLMVHESVTDIVGTQIHVLYAF